ncbi:MAG: DUF1963 domain-containing protein [Cyanobacteria bacterium TGS_CYA1]|nr:DUF1963 domain-containing protein [Cyanobacteria bacterium TGS_CYA1]
MNYDQAVDLIENSSFQCKQFLLDSLLPTISIATKQCDIQDMPLGSSRMGGVVADVPESFEWPVWKNSESNELHHLDFIAQINLNDIAKFEANKHLPPKGMLYFFYVIEDGPWGFDPKDKGSSRIFYYPGPVDSLQRRIPPITMEETFACSLTFSEAWTVKNSLYGVETDDEDTEDIMNLIHQISEDALEHQMFGNPIVIQNEMEEECQLVTNGIYCGDGTGYGSEKAKELQPGIKDWKLLLQIDSDENPGWMWGDVGRIYFWIREADLEALEFDKAWMIFQCY